MKIQLPNDVDYIIKELQKHGHEAYAVGGCVRDVILGREPEDWDITTSASPYKVKEIFRRTIDTGIVHGTVTVMLDKKGYEVTTYRIDGEYEDNRHPKEVKYTPYLFEDLMRRDFTINAMAYNEDSGLVDIFEGHKDLKDRCIRCVGSADKRFDEDALRILRAVRFSAQLGFDIEEETLLAVREKAVHLRNISAERIRSELNKLLLSPNPDKLITAYELGITRIVLPEFDFLMEKEVTEETQKRGVLNLKYISLLRKEEQEIQLDGEKEPLILSWAMLLNGLPAGEGREVLKRLKFDNETIEYVYRLLTWQDFLFLLTPWEMRKAVNAIGKDLISMLFCLKEMRILVEADAKENDETAEIKEARSLYESIISRNECVELKDLKINGKDLIELGMKPGKEIGQVLEKLLEIVLLEPDLNTKEYLSHRAEEFVNKLQTGQ